MKVLSKAKYFQFNEVQLSDNPSGYEWVQLLKSGTFKHPNAPQGEFSITGDILSKMVANFEENTRRLKGRELAVDYSHDAGGKASGWIKNVALREDGSQLWIEVNWTPSARQMLEEGEFRYISADIDFDYMDNESGNTHGPTLLGAGLTNRPHIKDMEIILSEQGENGMSAEDIMKAINSLSPEDKAGIMSKLGLKEGDKEDKAMLEEKEEEVKDAKAELSEAKTKLDTVTKENTELKAEKTNLVKEAKFSEFLSKGVIVPAQKETFMKMDIELSEEFFGNADSKLNLDEKGTSNDKKKVVEEKSFEVLLGEKATELMKNDDTLQLREAYSQVLDSNPELRKQYEGTEE